MLVSKIKELRDHSSAIYRLEKGRTRDEILTCSADKHIASWSVREKTQLPFSIKLDIPAFSMLISSSRNQMIIGNRDGGIHVIDLAAKKEARLFDVHKKGVFAILEWPSKKWIICAGGDGSISIWDEKWELVRQIPVSSFKIRSMLVHDDHLLIGCGEGFLRVFEGDFLNEINRINAHQDGINSIELHPKGKLITTAGKDGFLRFFKSDGSYELVREIPAHNFGIYRIAYSNDLCLTASRDKSIKVWDNSTFEPLLKIIRPDFETHTHSVNDVSWINESEFTSVGDDRRLIFWKITK